LDSRKHDNDTRPRVGVVISKYGRGGAGTHAVWAIQALRDSARVEFITCSDVHLNELNRFYGTDLRQGDFTFAPPPLPRWLRTGNRLCALRDALFYRHVVARARELDAVISAHNCLNVGVRAIQYIADVYFDVELSRAYLQRQPPSTTLLQRVYQRLVRITVGSPRHDVVARDMVLVNSRWIGQIVSRKFGVPVQVLYPPVAACPVPVSLDGRENGFVCLGRLVPEKKVDQIVAIVGQLRDRGHDVHLHIVGGLDDSPYCRRLQDLCRGLGWVRLEGLLSGVRKWEMLARHRYGIHACLGEAFGIVVAEMMMAGCVPFVPSEGGTAEIVQESQLVYRSPSDAVKQIDALLRNPSEVARLSEFSASRAKRFCVSRFKEELNIIVESFLSRKEPSNAQ